MKLQDKLDAFKANFETKVAPPTVVDLFHKTTAELIATGQAERARDGRIAYAEVSPGYTKRPDPSELLPVLRKLAAVAA
jgi:hypothetical protein